MDCQNVANLWGLISWVTGFLYYNVRLFNTLLNIRLGVNSCEKHQSPTNNNDSTVPPMPYDSIINSISKYMSFLFIDRSSLNRDYI